MRTIKKILVPTDFSDFSLAGMEYACSVAGPHDAQIYFLNVVDRKPALPVHPEVLHGENILEDHLEKAQMFLEIFMTKKYYLMRDIKPVVRHGDAAREIVKFAREEGIDIIIMATHGRTGLAHVLLGSVTEKVVRYSSVPVLTVKPEEMSEKIVLEEDIEEQLHLSL